MIALLIRAGLSERFAAVVAWAIAAALALAAIWWLRSDAYADGVAATDARWKAASEKLQRQADAAADKADGAADARASEYLEKVETEKERIDEAARDGSSPFDVLFGGNGM